MFNASLDLSEFRELAEKSRRTIKLFIARGVGKAAAEGAAEAKTGHFKDRTGRLRSEIKARFLRTDGMSVEWELLSPTPYAKFVEEGTRPHDIWPKAGHNLKGPVRNGQTRRATGKGPHEHIVGRGIALRFMMGGRWIFRRMVKHKGSRPYPFMGLGYLKAERVLWREMALMEQQLENIWR
jgi:hypothetical protein